MPKMPTHSFACSKTSGALAKLSVFVLLTSACALPGLPKDEAKARKSYEDAIDYAKAAQDAYITWLDHNSDANASLGAAAIALTGAGLGMVAANSSTKSIAAIGAAGGTAIALDQWLIGPPSKDPKVKALSNAEAQVQCVIDDARAEKPDLPADYPGSRDASSVAKAVISKERILTEKAGELRSTLTLLPDSCDTSDPVRQARLTLAQATLASRRAEGISKALAAAPDDIVDAVGAIHRSALVAALGSGLDSSTIPKPTLVVSPSKSGTAPSGKTPSKSMSAEAITLSCNAILAHPAFTNAQAQLNEINLLLGGAVAAQKSFAECINSPKPSPSPSGDPTSPPTGGTATKAPSPKPLAILPGFQLAALKRQTLTLTIFGGHPPYDFIDVDPGSHSAAIPNAVVSGALDLRVVLDDTVRSAGPYRLLIMDSAGTQEPINIEAAQTLASQ